MALIRNGRYLRFPPVHRVELEEHQRVEMTRSPHRQVSVRYWQIVLKTYGPPRLQGGFVEIGG
jgi:hypothetical protein